MNEHQKERLMKDLNIQLSADINTLLSGEMSRFGDMIGQIACQ